MWLCSITLYQHQQKQVAIGFSQSFHSELKDTVMSIHAFMFKQSSPEMTEADTVKTYTEKTHLSLLRKLAKCCPATQRKLSVFGLFEEWNKRERIPEKFNFQGT